MLEPSKEIWRFIKNNWANWLNVTKTRDRVLLLGTTTLSESFFVGAEEREERERGELSRDRAHNRTIEEVQELLSPQSKLEKNKELEQRRVWSWGEILLNCFFHGLPVRLLNKEKGFWKARQEKEEEEEEEKKK
jgi:hypothetical protein